MDWRSSKTLLSSYMVIYRSNITSVVPQLRLATHGVTFRRGC